MEKMLENLLALIPTVCGKIVLALLVLIIGRIIIKAIVKLVKKGKFMSKTEGEVQSFTVSFVSIGLNVLLFISIIGILGVPMASIITVLASAGVAVGLALQGALSNLAGGIMLMLFKPFHVGNYVEASGVAGVVQEVTLFYTVFLTLDNKRVTVPNGSLMNANVVNYSSEELRRVDLTFSCAKSEDSGKIQSLMLDAMNNNEKVLKDPAPFARISGGTDTSMIFTVRAWCKNADYWDVYFDLTEAITNSFAGSGVKAPAIRVISND